MHLNLLYSQAALLTYFRLTNAASIPKKPFCCVSQYTPPHVRYELLMGPLDPLSLGYKILCRVPAILFFHGLPPIQPFYSESHAYTKFSTLAFSQGFFLTIILSSSRTSGFPKWIQRYLSWNCCLT